MTEGVFLWDIDVLLDRAHLIVWLDLGWPLCVSRIVARHVRLSLAGRNPHRGLRLLVRFAVGQRAYRRSWSDRLPTAADDFAALTRAATIRVLRPHRHKVVRCATPSHVEQLMDSLAGLGL